MKRIARTLAVTLLLATPAQAVTLSEFRSASREFQEGYVWGLVEFLTSIVSDNTEYGRAAAYQKCFQENKIHSVMALEIVERHVARTPEAATTPMVGLVLNSIYQACKRYVEKQGG